MKPARTLFALVAGLWLSAVGRDLGDVWIDATQLPALNIATSVEVLDRDGALLRAYTVADGRWRMAVDPAQVDPTFIAALLAYEDQRFYDHAGVDPRALLRAMGQAVRNGRILSGGSTITMQVARLLENSGTGAVDGKLRQIRVALALERRLTKPQILKLYLLLAPYGGNLEGIRAATLSYFGKEPRRLTPAEVALLVAIPQSPETRRPDRSPVQADLARNRVIARALRDKIIDAEQARAATSEPVLAQRRPFPTLAPHMSDRARNLDPSAQTVHLTVDKSLQIALEELAANVVQGQGDRLQVAMVVADHQSGEILASVGSAAFRGDARQGFIDMTTALRSPGSTLKPLVYGLAFDQGLAHPETLIDDRPTDFSGYRPQNFDRQYRGEIRIREALQLSLNIPVVALTEALGPPRLLQALDKAGVKFALPNGQPGLAIALGGIGVSLHDMVQLYATIARGGVPLSLISQAGEVRAQSQRVLQATSAWQVSDIMAGLAPPPGAPESRLAYKTGTSYGHRDAWAIGFDGQHVIGIWMGRPDGTPVPGAFGADLAAPVLFQAFARLKPTLTPQPAAPPETLLLANNQLPQPLQRFRARNAAFAAAPDAPQMTFPPDNGEVELLDGALLAKVRGGTAPFTWLANGLPVLIATQDRDVLLPHLGRGFLTLSVIDASGRSSRVSVRLR
ncbi:MAG: penicillin-binding protein 1C [Microgenomates group bacterium]